MREQDVAHALAVVRVQLQQRAIVGGGIGMMALIGQRLGETEARLQVVRETTRAANDLALAGIRAS